MVYTGNTCPHTHSHTKKTEDIKMTVCNKCNTMMDYVVTYKRYVEMGGKPWPLIQEGSDEQT